MKKGIIRILLIIIGLLLLAAVILVATYILLNQTNGVIESSGQRRRYLLYVPTTYDPSTPTPLVISLHGFAEWPAHQRDISGWNDLADELGIIVVYPSGTDFPLRWITANPPGMPNEPFRDVIFISDLIDKLAGEYNIDQARIYANGLSNGGGMSYLLACKLSEKITAIGGVAGAYGLPWSECDPTRPVPVIAFHGTADSIVPYGGGATSRHAYEFPNVPDWAAMWSERNGCEVGPVDLPLNGEVSGVKYTNCQDKADVVFYTIQGGGHSWPGGEPMPRFIVGHTTQDIDATRVMWAFFSRYSLREWTKTSCPTGVSG
jgi:polyhydroxybutyrate depolymerase